MERIITTKKLAEHEPEPLLQTGYISLIICRIWLERIGDGYLVVIGPLLGEDEENEISEGLGVMVAGALIHRAVQLCPDVVNVLPRVIIGQLIHVGNSAVAGFLI